jgi:hypothetical protein
MQIHLTEKVLNSTEIHESKTSIGKLILNLACHGENAWIGRKGLSLCWSYRKLVMDLTALPFDDDLIS